jgi:hypothetical protein
MTSRSYIAEEIPMHPIPPVDREAAKNDIFKEK